MGLASKLAPSVGSGAEGALTDTAEVAGGFSIPDAAPQPDTAAASHTPRVTKMILSTRFSSHPRATLASFATDASQAAESLLRRQQCGTSLGRELTPECDGAGHTPAVARPIPQGWHSVEQSIREHATSGACSP